MKERGQFIVFEGIDGSGKSTQIKMLSAYLSEKGICCYQTREPTDSPFGCLVHTCMTGRVQTDERAIAALFAADRLDHIFNEVNGIKKKLDEGVSVLCDRYYLSSFAYNGGLVPTEWVIALNAQARDALRPDLTVFLDVLPEEGMTRVERRGDRERYEKLEFQRKLRENYFELFRRFGEEEHVVVVKSEADKAETQKGVRRAADGLYGF